MENLVNCFAVFLYGNKFFYSSPNYKLCLGVAETQSKYGKYVEIWNYHEDGSRSLVSYWN